MEKVVTPREQGLLDTMSKPVNSMKRKIQDVADGNDPAPHGNEDSAPAKRAAVGNYDRGPSQYIPRKRAKFRKAVLKEFFPDEDISLGNIIALLGRKGSGKTTVVKALCYALADAVDMAVVISPTAIGNEFHHFVPITCIHNKFDMDYLEHLIDYQTKKWEDGDGKEVLLVLDDCAYDAAMFRCEAFRKLFFNCRWAHITVIIASQSALNMPTYLRDQIDVTISACFRSERAMDQLYENYFSVFPRFVDFKRTMMKIAQKRTMLVTINSFSEDNGLASNVFWYKAPYPVPEFKMGDARVWEANDQCFVNRKSEQEYIARKKQEIEDQIEEDKMPLYEIEKDTTRPHIPANTLAAKKRKRRTIFNANPNTIAPKAMRRVYNDHPAGRPVYNAHTARSYHSQEEVARKRMRHRYGS